MNRSVRRRLNNLESVEQFFNWFIVISLTFGLMWYWGII